MNDQNAKRDGGKLMLSLVPTEIWEDIAVVRMYGNMKYPEGGTENWKKVEPERYIDALCRHLIAYIRGRYTRDPESNIPHLFHMACNVAFLCTLEAENGTVPTAQEVLKQMRNPAQLGGSGTNGNPSSGTLYSEGDKTPRNSLKPPCSTCVYLNDFSEDAEEECKFCITKQANKYWEELKKGSKDG